jgi:hypothetical protein
MYAIGRLAEEMDPKMMNPSGGSQGSAIDLGLLHIAKQLVCFSLLLSGGLHVACVFLSNSTITSTLISTHHEI